MPHALPWGWESARCIFEARFAGQSKTTASIVREISPLHKLRKPLDWTRK